MIPCASCKNASTVPFPPPHSACACTRAWARSVPAHAPRACACTMHARLPPRRPPTVVREHAACMCAHAVFAHASCMIFARRPFAPPHRACERILYARTC
eukprot:4098647-Pleurochrysis_carterae.AAC.1